MTGPTQALHAAESSSSNPPVLKPIDSGDDLSKYGMTCNIESVYYYSDDESPTTRAAVLLNFGFDPAGANLKYVKFSTCVVGVPRLVMEGFPLSEQLNFDSPMHGRKHATLQLVRLYAGLDGLKWMFFIKDCHFPCSVKILLDLKSYGDLPNPFRFSLQIPRRLHICVKPKSWWHFWMTSLRPKHGHQGWSCDIEEDYHPDIAKSILVEYRPRGDMYRFQGIRQSMVRVCGYDLGQI